MPIVMVVAVMVMMIVTIVIAMVMVIMMVTMASVVVFVHDGSLLGPVLVAAIGAVYVGNLTRGSWGWIPFNAAACGLAALAA
ncbi:MAG: hypothetical protein KGO02_21650, partial [Alphaproteobacteria bacterium]|nr:hypothetical protein [Alphaproteobacteria bacterium]